MIDTKALRQKILDMAIKGKLVPQNPDDEPASVLLERIRAEKQQLIKEGKIKKDKNDSIIYKGDDNRYYEKIGSEVKDITDEVPFEILARWAGVKMTQIAQIELGKTLNKNTDEGEDVQYLCSINVQWEGIKLDFVKRAKFTTNEQEKYRLRKNDLLICEGGEAGRSSVWNHNDIMYYQNALHRVRFIKGINAYFFKAVFDRYSTMGLISKYCVGVTIKHLTSSALNAIFFPIPPLFEQQRIMSRVEELFDQIAAIEQNQAGIDTLYDEFRKRTLTLAIQGKLVPQDPNDEPASVLLERIRAEKKAKLGKKFVDSYIYKGDDNCYYEKIKDSLKEISDEIPFDVPESWQWIRIDNLFQHNTGKALNSSNTKGILHPYITTSNVYWGHFNLDRVKEMPFTEDEFSKCSIVPGDLLVCEGGDVGRAAIWEKDILMCIQNHIHRLRAYHPVCAQFYYFAFFVYKSIGLIGGKGIGVQGLSSGALGKLIFPLPPLAEQERIVKQVEIILERLKDEG